MKLMLIICALLIGSIPTVEDHDIHISRCEIEYAPKKEKVELTMSIFYDDLLEAVGLRKGEELPEDYKNADELISKFIENHFIIEINGETKELKYIESNSYPPAVWTTLEFLQDEKINEIKIKNTILLDLFDDQTNIVTLDWKGKKKTFAMDQKNHLITLK